MARSRKYPPNTTAAQRVAISDARLTAAGGAKKAFRLSAAANAALQHLMGCPNAPSTETGLIERMLLTASAEARRQHAALFGSTTPDGDDHHYRRPFEHLVLGRAPKKEGVGAWFSKPENVVMPYELWRMHTLIRHAPRAANGAAKLAIDMARQVLWSGGRVIILDPEINPDDSHRFLMNECRENFPGMQLIKTKKDLELVDRSFDWSASHFGGSAMLYVCHTAARAKNEDGYNVFVSQLRNYLATRLGAVIGAHKLPPIPYLVILTAGAADGVFRHVCAARMRAVGSSLVVLADNDDELSEWTEGNLCSTIQVTSESGPGNCVRYLGRISRRRDTENTEEFIIAQDVP